MDKPIILDMGPMCDAFLGKCSIEEGIEKTTELFAEQLQHFLQEEVDKAKHLSKTTTMSYEEALEQVWKEYLENN